MQLLSRFTFTGWVHLYIFIHPMCIISWKGAVCWSIWPSIHQIDIRFGGWTHNATPGWINFLTHFTELLLFSLYNFLALSDTPIIRLTTNWIDQLVIYPILRLVWCSFRILVSQKRALGSILIFPYCVCCGNNIVWSSNTKLINLLSIAQDIPFHVSKKMELFATHSCNRTAILIKFS